MEVDAPYTASFRVSAYRQFSETRHVLQLAPL